MRPPDDLPIVGTGVLVQARVCRERPAKARGDDAAQVGPSVRMYACIVKKSWPMHDCLIICVSTSGDSDIVA